MKYDTYFSYNASTCKGHYEGKNNALQEIFNFKISKGILVIRVFKLYKCSRSQGPLYLKT